MSDLISKSALLNRIATEVHYDTENPLEQYGKLMGAINSQPTVDAVKVVRCRDCKYRIGGEEGWCIDGIPFNGDDMGRVETEGNDFCSYGERREDER